jgi:hypothetical protein
MSDTPKMAADPNELGDQAATIIQVLWDKGIVVACATSMMHADGVHKLEVASSIPDDYMGQTIGPLMPSMLLVLQGVLPKDAKVNG